jgi:hypothetical protein
MPIETAVSIDKELRTKAIALDLFNAILERKAPTQVIAMSDAEFMRLYRMCFQQLAVLDLPRRTSAIPSAEEEYLE